MVCFFRMKIRQVAIVLYCFCFYKINEDVLFVSGIKRAEGNLFLVAQRCLRNNAFINNSSVMDNEYVPNGDKFLIEPEELANAENLCEKCLNCKYCIHNRFEENITEVESLDCGLHKKVLPDAATEMIPNCAYAWEPIRFEPLACDHPKDIKPVFRDIAHKHPRVFVPTSYYTIPPETLISILSGLSPDDIVYFGTGASRGKDGSKIIHETVDEYLNNTDPDEKVLCFHVKDISRDVIDLLTNELSSDDLYYVILIPKLELACFGDDTSDCRDGFVVYGPEKILREKIVPRERSS